ncbi:hypothetical protein ACGF1Z_31380 [Streptomyces sp. NPDC048018]|uniref:hypothetical protein n=1 Tax=Streptomyces sp. NPDC048018 TaxID=3365499 RepID=UPI003714E85A
MPVSRGAYRALQARYELALKQRDDARNSLNAARTITKGYAEEIESLRELLTQKGGHAVTIAEHDRLRRAYVALEQQLLAVQASNEEMCREAREKAEASL